MHLLRRNTSTNVLQLLLDACLGYDDEKERTRLLDTAEAMAGPIEVPGRQEAATAAAAAAADEGSDEGESEKEPPRPLPRVCSAPAVYN